MAGNSQDEEDQAIAPDEAEQPDELPMAADGQTTEGSDEPMLDDPQLERHQVPTICRLEMACRTLAATSDVAEEPLPGSEAFHEMSTSHSDGTDGPADGLDGDLYVPEEDSTLLPDDEAAAEGKVHRQEHLCLGCAWLIQPDIPGSLATGQSTM